jgi:redox-sensitive bicupin YhaK (pirin superfamily)
MLFLERIQTMKRTMSGRLLLVGVAAIGGITMDAASKVEAGQGKVVVRKAEDRGLADFGWLKSRHSFSFGAYHDPNHMGFRSLRVINDDHVDPAKGFDTHPHDNMEIISYVVAGAIEHKDSMGTGSVVRPGDVQRMSAGTGVEHSEFNPSDTEGVHFLQIWILPEQQGLEPSYEQKHFQESEKRGALRLIGSRDGRDGSITIHQDVNMYAGLFDHGENFSLPLQIDRYVWVQVVGGTVRVNGIKLHTGDAVAISEADELEIEGVDNAEVLVFDLG